MESHRMGIKLALFASIPSAGKWGYSLAGWRRIEPLLGVTACLARGLALEACPSRSFPAAPCPVLFLLTAGSS